MYSTIYRDSLLTFLNKVSTVHVGGVGIEVMWWE